VSYDKILELASEGEAQQEALAALASALSSATRYGRVGAAGNFSIPSIRCTRNGVDGRLQNMSDGKRSARRACACARARACACGRARARMGERVEMPVQPQGRQAGAQGDVAAVRAGCMLMYTIILLIG